MASLQQVLEVLIQSDTAELQKIVTALGGVDTAAQQAGKGLDSVAKGGAAGGLRSVGDGAQHASDQLKGAGDSGNAAGSALGRLLSQATGTTAGLLGLGEASRVGGDALSQMVAGASAAGPALGGIVAGAVAAGAALLVAAGSFHIFTESVGEIVHFGEMFDLTAQQVASLGLSMARVGVDSGTLRVGLTIAQTGIEGISNAIETGGTVSGPFVNGLRNIGVSAFDAQGQLKPLGALLPEIFDGFQKTAAGAEAEGHSFNAAATARELFGRTGALLVPALLEGASALDASTDAGNRAAVTSELVQQRWREWTAASADLHQAFDDVGTIIGAALAPALTSLAKFIAPAVEGFGHLASAVGPYLTASIQAVADALHSLFTGDWAKLGDQLGAIFGQVQGALLRLATWIVSSMPAALAGLANLAEAAGTWGWNLIVSFAQGMAEAASSVITAVLNEIGNLISQFLASFSPPKKGALTEIDTWGQNLIQTYLEGMTKADFGILDQVTAAIKDVLTINQRAGDFPEEGLIPRLLGSQEVVAEAITQMRELGSVSQDTFDALAASVGTAGDQVVTLFQNLLQLGQTETAIEAVKGQITDLEGQVRHLDSAYRAASAPLTAQIKSWEDYFKAQQNALDATISKLEQYIRVREQALVTPGTTALTVAQAEAAVPVAQGRVTAAEAAPETRSLQINKDIRDVQRQIAEIRTKDKITQQDQNRIGDLQTKLGELQLKLGKEGVLTDQDRLDIATARLELANTQTKLAQLKDPGLAQAKEELQTTKDQKAALTEQETEITGPLKAALTALTEQHDTAKTALEEQLQTLKDQQTDLEGIRAGEQKAIDAALGRLKVEKSVSDELKTQADLLAQQAAGGKGGAGGGGAGGAGKLGGVAPGIAGLKLAKPEPIQPIKIQPFDPDVEAAKFREAVKKAFEKAITGAFTNLTLDTALIGAGLGVVLFGPLGLIVGAGVGAAIGAGLSKIDWGSVWSNLKADVGAVQSAIQPAVSFLEHAWDTIAPAAKAALSGIGEAASTVFTFAVGEARRVITFFQQEWPQIEQLGAKALNGIKQGLQGFVIGWDAFVNAGGLKVALAGLEVMWAVSIDIIKGIWATLSTAIDVGVTVILGAIGLVIALLNGDWSTAWHQVETTVSGVLDAVLPGWRTFVSSMLRIGQEFANWLQFAFTQVVIAFSGAWDGVTASMGHVKDIVAGALTTALQTIEGWISGTFNATSRAVHAAWQTIAEKVGDAATAFETAKTKAEGLGGAIGGPFQATLSAVEAFFRNIGTAVGIVSGAVQTLWNLITNLPKLPSIPGISGSAPGGDTFVTIGNLERVVSLLDTARTTASELTPILANDWPAAAGAMTPALASALASISGIGSAAGLIVAPLAAAGEAGKSAGEAIADGFDKAYASIIAAGIAANDAAAKAQALGANPGGIYNSLNFWQQLYMLGAQSTTPAAPLGGGGPGGLNPFGGGVTRHAEGGLISHPTLLIDAWTGTLSTMAERGPEWILPSGQTPPGSGPTIHNYFQAATLPDEQVRAQMDALWAAGAAPAYAASRW